MGTATGAYLHLPEASELRWLGETSAYFLATGEQTNETFTLSGVDVDKLLPAALPKQTREVNVKCFDVVRADLEGHRGDLARVLASLPARRRASCDAVPRCAPRHRGW